MRRLALVPLFLTVFLLPFHAGAVGLGSIETHSALNQRLDAEIPLRGVTPDNADTVSIALASERAFREVGLSRPALLSQLRFEVVERDGGLFVHVTSVERITEPYLSFLIEVDASTGNLLREYTILLDPPVFATDEAEPAAEPEPAPEPDVATEPADEPADVATAEEPAGEATPRRRDRFGDEPVFMEVERERDRVAAEQRAEAERRAAEEAAAARADGAATPEPAMPETYTTESGDTAWEIAARMAAGEVSTQQMMIALLRNNPDAFVNDNVNRLRDGYVLRTPTRDEAAAISAQEAIARIDRQNTLWREWRDGMRASAAPVEADAATAADAVEPEAETTDQLQIVGASDGGERAAGDDTADGTAEQQKELQLAREQLESARLEKEELQSRVGELESMVERMDRLINQRNEELARLQDRLIELAEQEDVTVDPELLPEEEATSEEIADADTAEDPPEAVEVDIDIDTLDAIIARLATVAVEREQTLIARAEEAAAGEDEAERDDQSAIAATDTGTPPDSGVETIRTQPGDDGLLSRLMAPLSGIVAAAGGIAGAASASLPGGPLGLAGIAAALLALAALLIMRRRQSSGEEAVDVGDVELTDGDDDDAFADLIDDEASDFDQTSETAAADVSGLMDAPERESESDAGDEMTNEDPLAALDDDVDGGMDDAEKDDTIAEADVYLAYGLHQQARDLLTLAIQESPDRADYHEKLLETLYSGGEKEEFERQAARFHGRVDASSRGLWNRVVAMGQEIAPENELFRDAGDPGITADEIRRERPETTDIDLDEGQGGEVDLDFSLDDEDDDSTAVPPTTDFDQTVITQAPGETAREEDSPDTTTGDDELEFDLGDLDDFAADASEAEAGDAVPERTAASPDADSERTVDSDAQDVEFDLSELESETGSTPAASAAEPTAAAEATQGRDDELDFDIGDHDLGEAPAATEQDSFQADSTDEFDVSDLDPEATTVAGHELDEDVSMPDGAADEQQTADSDEAGDLEFDLSELEDLGSAGAEEPTEPASSPAAGNDQASPASDDDSEPDEFDTMLDLARAYIDMGDQESATSALEEVVASGSDAQRTEAQNLLENAS